MVNGSWVDRIVPYGDSVTVQITFYTTTAEGKRIPVKSVERVYPVVEHKNRVTVCVRDYDSGKPVENANIELVSSVSSYTGTTGKDGCYTFEGVLDGDYNAVITSDNYLPANRSLGTVKSDVKKTFRIFRPADVPKIVPAAIKIDNESYAAIPAGSTAKLELRIVLPPRTTGGYVKLSITNPAGGYILKDKELQVKPSPSGGEQTVSVKVDVPSDALVATDIGYAHVSAEANVSVRTEGGTEYKVGDADFELAVVPPNVQLKCSGDGAAYVTFKYNGQLTNSVPPPKEGQTRTASVVLYYGSCSSGNPAVGATLTVNGKEEKINLYGSEPFEAQVYDGAATVEIKPGEQGKKIPVSAVVEFKDGASANASNTLTVGVPIYLVLVQDGELIADGKKHEIIVEKYNPTSGKLESLRGDEIGKLQVCVTGTTAELVGNPPICMNNKGKITIAAK